jgi:hypothetical protein
MTNAEYIKSRMSDADLAGILEERFSVASKFIDQIRDAFNNWSHSVSGNHGNMAKGNHEKTVIKENPSIWAFEVWKMPDGTWRRKGRTKS